MPEETLRQFLARGQQIQADMDRVIDEATAAVKGAGMSPRKRRGGSSGGITRLEGAKVVVRQTAVLERGVPLIVELHAKYLHIRLKGKQTGGVSLAYDLILDVGRKRAIRRTA